MAVHETRQEDTNIVVVRGKRYRTVDYNELRYPTVLSEAYGDIDRYGTTTMKAQATSNVYNEAAVLYIRTPDKRKTHRKNDDA